MMVGVEIVVFAAIGLAVGFGAALLLPDLFTQPRSLTVLTGLASALLLGWIGHTVIGRHLGETAALSAIGTALLVSVLAQPRKAAHRAGRRKAATQSQRPPRAPRPAQAPEPQAPAAQRPTARL
jgi:hypothetical protein